MLCYSSCRSVRLVLHCHERVDRGSIFLIILMRKGSTNMAVNPTQMLIQVLFTREATAGVALAVGIRAHEILLWAPVLFVNFALMSEESARVCEATQFLTSRSVAAVRAIVFIHMFCPFAASLEGLADAFGTGANNQASGISGSFWVFTIMERILFNGLLLLYLLLLFLHLS